MPSEDRTFRSDLVNGDQITWNGGGEATLVTIDDPSNATFDEAQSNQTLAAPVTFDGVSYLAGQVVTPTYTIVFSGSDGNTYTLTSFNFSPNTNNEVPDAVFWEGSIPPAGTVLTVTSEINPTGGSSRDYATFVTCFCDDTWIETAQGPQAVQNLKDGDVLRTQDGRLKEVLRVFRRYISPRELRQNARLRPVRIMQGALGQGLPVRDTWVSRQHRICLSSPICRRMFGRDEVLVSAIKLTELPGVFVDTDISEVTYHHILMREHEIIFANGAATESLYLGAMTLAGLPDDAMREIRAIFPELDGTPDDFPSSHVMPTGRQQRRLIERHLKRQKSL